MADDNVIRVGTSVDTAALKAGLTTATDAVSRAVVDLRAQYDQLTARGKELREVLSSKINPAALESVRQEAAALTQQQAILRAQLTAANQALKEQSAISAGLAPSLAQVAAAEAAQADEARVAALESAKLAEARLATAAATEAEAVAARAAAEAEAALAVNTTQARFAAQLLSREVGIVLPRALSSVAAQSAALGPILEAAFPYGVAAFLGIELGKIIVKGYDLYDNWINLKEASLALDATTRKTFESIQADLEGANRATEEYLRLMAQVARTKAQESASAGDSSGAAAASEQARAGLAAADKFRRSVEGQRQIDPSKLLDFKKLGKLSDDSQKSIAKAFAPGTIAEAGDRIAEIGPRLMEIKALLADFNPMGGKTKKDLEVEQGYLEDAVVKWKAVADRYIAQSNTDQARFEHDQAEAVKQGTQEQLAAQRARSERLRQAETTARQSITNAMTELETRDTKNGVMGRALTLDKINLIDSEIAKYHQLGDVVRQLEAESAKLGEQAAAQKKALEDKGFQVAKESLAKLAEETRKSNEAQNKEFEDGLRKRIQEQQKQLEADKAFLAEDSEIKVGNLQTQKVALQAKGEIAGPDKSSLNPLANTQAVNQLAAVQDIDRQILNERIQFQQQLAAIDQASGNSREYAKDLQSINQLQQQSSQKQIQDHVQMLQTMEAQWNNYFNIVNQGVLKGVNGWIAGNETFAQASRQMLVQLTQAFADYFVQMGLKELEQLALHQIFGTQYAAIDDLVNAKKIASQTATIATINTEVGTSNLGQVASYAAVAGAAAAAATAAIPIIGPALAPEVGATMYATVLGTYGPLTIPAFETGGIVPATGIALVHQNEGVLTAPQTQWLQSAAQGGAAGRGTANINTTINNSGLTDATFKAMASKHAGHITRTVLKGMRSANLV